ncbi:MAG: hypothetical protein HOI66_22075 [Verrucomicrobia bacterium]|nr:hypothetical protein [Verrucomicrobiota bacterium]MBT6425229.1 hypothetical protein [Bacteroidetes Order II. bacterium]
MPRGGARINSGPKPGYLAERRQELQDLVARSGVDPAERILSIAKEAEGRGDWQLAMAGIQRDPAATVPSPEGLSGHS